MASTTLTVEAMVERLGAFLNDDPKNSDDQRWPEKMRISAIAEALRFAQKLKPKAFAESVEIELVAGSKQTLPDDFACLLSIDCNEDGSPVATEEDANDAFLKATTGLSLGCGKAGSYDGVVSYSVSDADDSTFFVVPPVPAGATSTITATAVKSVGDVTTSSCIPCDLEVPVREWALYVLYSHEDSRAYEGKCQKHYRAFFDALQIHHQYRQRKDAYADGLQTYEVR